MTTTTWTLRQPICYALYKRIERFLPVRVKRLWPRCPVPIQEVPSPRISVDKLADAIRPFLEEPIAAIWFIDEPTEYHALLRKAPPHIPPDKTRMTFWDIPIYLFLSPAYSKEEMARCPAFCHEPGLWLEMEDGNHRKLKGWCDEG